MHNTKNKGAPGSEICDDAHHEYCGSDERGDRLGESDKAQHLTVAELMGAAFDTCIVIRTLVLHKGRLRTCRPAAGEPLRSDPQEEQQECLNKLAALETALRLAEARS